MEYRAGIGYDAHRLAEGRKLIVGGVDIPYERGLAGHSDADVLTHAIADSLLGAAGCGDIGRRFPDTDEAYKNVSSLTFLTEVRAVLREKKYTIVNVDAVVIAQEPKLAPYFKAMEFNISGALGIPADRVNVKATTEEGLGFTGDGSGIAAKAVCSIKNITKE